MTAREIAERLVALCREGKVENAQNELYAADAINIEPCGTPAFPKETKGLNAIIEKGHKFTALIEHVYLCVVDDGVSAERAHHLRVASTAHRRYLGSQRLRDLARPTADTA